MIEELDFEKKSFENIEEDLKKLPYTSGIYYFYDKDNKLLYIGKAKKLNSRIWEHRENNLFDREGKFYLKIQKEKGFHSREEWPEALDAAFKDFQIRYMFHHQRPIVIDMIFHRIKRIEIEEMPHELN